MKLPNAARKALLPAVAMLCLWALVAPSLADRLIVAKSMDRADVILVLAGSRAYLERTEKAASLYKERVAPRILLTNDGKKASWSSVEQINPAFLELARRSLLAQGIPESAIEILPTEVTGTIAEAQLVGKHAADRRWKSILIVTSAYHTRRALRTFEKVFAANDIGTRIGIAPAQDDEGLSFYWWLTWGGWPDVAGEYVKSAYYDLAY